MLCLSRPSRFFPARIPARSGTETPAPPPGASGFSWLSFSRLKLHLCNLRHIQHHTGAAERVTG